MAVGILDLIDVYDLSKFQIHRDGTRIHCPLGIRVPSSLLFQCSIIYYPQSWRVEPVIDSAARGNYCITENLRSLPFTKQKPVIASRADVDSAAPGM